MPSKIPAPPEAKLTPVIGNALLLLDLDTRERYGGGEATNPTFSAAKQTQKNDQIFFKKMTHSGLHSKKEIQILYIYLITRPNEYYLLVWQPMVN